MSQIEAVKVSEEGMSEVNMAIKCPKYKCLGILGPYAYAGPKVFVPCKLLGVT